MNHPFENGKQIEICVICSVVEFVNMSFYNIGKLFSEQNRIALSDIKHSILAKIHSEKNSGEINHSNKNRDWFCEKYITQTIRDQILSDKDSFLIAKR